MVKVSVVIPTYQRPQELARAIKSAINQELEDIEILVVNDGSSGSIEATKRLFEHDNRVRFLDNGRKKGANGARNTGIGIAKGAYVALLDDDDEWYPAKLSAQVKRLEGLDQTWGGVYGSYEILKREKWESRKALKEGMFMPQLLDSTARICAGSTLMVRKEVFDAVGLFDELLTRHQDLEFMCRFFQKFKLAAVEHPIAKIYGHNPPDPYQAEVSKKEFLLKILPYLEKLSSTGRKRIYANHYQELVVLFAKNFKIIKMIEYLKMSYRNGRRNPKDVILPFLYLFLSSIEFSAEKIKNQFRK